MPRLSRALALCLLLLCVIGLAATLSRSQAEEISHWLWLPQVRNAPAPTIPPTIPAACAARFPLEADVVYGVLPGWGWQTFTKIVTNTQEIALVPYCSYYYKINYSLGLGFAYYWGEELHPILGPSQVFSQTGTPQEDNSVAYYRYDCVGIRPECPLPPTRLNVPAPSPTPRP
jgi:hypothetical protein